MTNNTSMTDTDIADIRKLIAEESERSKKEKDEADAKAKKEKCKYDFTYWLKDLLTSGWSAIPIYLPFIPLIWSFLHPGLSDFKNWFGDMSVAQLLTFSFVVQTLIIFCIIVFQLYVYSQTEKDGLKKSLNTLLHTATEEKIRTLPLEFFRFTHTNNSSDPQKNWEHLQKNFHKANDNIFWFKLSWIILWANWFCYYIALLVASRDANVHALFDFFMITEILCFFMCYYLLSYQSKQSGVNNFWWIVVVIMLLVTLGIVDFVATATSNAEFQMYTSILKTLLGCTFLGLLVAKLTNKVHSAPDWVKMLLFFYVALQPMLFAVFDLPIFTKLMDNPAYEDIFRLLQVIMFNLSLVLKYILMFYVVWLLKFDHFLVHYLRTQDDFSFTNSRRDQFEAELEKN